MCDAYVCLVNCYFSLYCCDISCHMHHKLFITPMHLVVVCKHVGGATTKCMSRHLRPPLLTRHTFRGELFYILLDTHISFYLNQIVLSSITKKGEIESAPRPLINFGDSVKHNLGGLTF
jgi:hypothetical protein